MALTWVAAALVFGSIMVFRPSQSFGPELLRATAYSTAGAMVTAGVLAAVALWRAAGALVRPLTLVRVFFAVAVVIALGSQAPWLGKLLTPVLAIGVAVVYVVALIATGEIGRADLELVRAVLARRRA